MGLTYTLNPTSKRERTMTDLAFAGYRAFAAGPDDPLRAKWNGVQASLANLPADLSWHEVSELNSLVNRAIHYLAEPSGVDIWQTPAMTWAQKTGDCEDFALLKYAALAKAGVVVRLVVGEIKSISGNHPHAWCAAHLANEWHTLDSMFDQIMPVSEYINWLPLAAMHDDVVVRFGREFTINEILDKAKV
jgi:predicted transglutaminase-like cysteine proteinase